MNKETEDHILQDMAVHLRDKFEQSMLDTVDSCERIGIERSVVIRMMTGQLLYLLIGMVTALGTNESSYLDICKAAWRRLHKSFLKMYDEQSQETGK